MMVEIRSDFTEKIKIRIYAHHTPFNMLNFVHKEKFYIYTIVLTSIKLCYLSPKMHLHTTSFSCATTTDEKKY